MCAQQRCKAFELCLQKAYRPWSLLAPHRSLWFFFLRKKMKVQVYKMFKICSQDERWDWKTQSPWQTPQRSKWTDGIAEVGPGRYRGGCSVSQVKEKERKKNTYELVLGIAHLGIFLKEIIKTLCQVVHCSFFSQEDRFGTIDCSNRLIHQAGSPPRALAY